MPAASSKSILLTEHEVAALLALSHRTLQRWRWLGQGPAFVKLGGAVRYERSEIERFIAAAREPAKAGEVLKR